MNSQPLETVSISRLPRAGQKAMPLPSPASTSARPIAWLGARSPFGLALPDAHPSASQLYAPRGVWLDDERLIVCDSGNHRILIWNTVPEQDGTPADVVLGQKDFESEGPASGGSSKENGLYLPTGVIVVNGKLVVGDAWHHRVLVWNQIPTQSNTPPDYAIGQSDLGSVSANRGANLPSANSMYWPYGVYFRDGRFYVADTGNRRVLGWNSFPESDRAADVVLGQPDFEYMDENRGGAVNARSFRWPHDLTASREGLFVADAGNHRILFWDGVLESDRDADRVIGQDQFAASYEFPYEAPGPNRLRFPYSIASNNEVLAAADTANNRILFWRLPLQSREFEPARDVIGQLDFAGNGENRWDAVLPDTICWPYGICLNRNLLAIADSGNNRVMLWDCRDILESNES
ncbi:MAG: NHL repeat-containing protein [Pirellulaceae bacterium]